MTQIAADTLGLPLENVTFKLGDSSLPKASVEGGSFTVATVDPPDSPVGRVESRAESRTPGVRTHPRTMHQAHHCHLRGIVNAFRSSAPAPKTFLTACGH